MRTFYILNFINSIKIKNIKPFAKTGDMFLLIGKGYPNGRYKTNLIIEIKVKDLLKLSEEQLDLVRKIKEIGER